MKKPKEPAYLIAEVRDPAAPSFTVKLRVAEEWLHPSASGRLRAIAASFLESVERAQLPPVNVVLEPKKAKSSEQLWVTMIEGSLQDFPDAILERLDKYVELIEASVESARV